MDVGSLVKIKGPKSTTAWARPAGSREGVGIIIASSHRIGISLRGCTVFWSADQTVTEIPEEWLEVIDEGR